MVTPTNLSKINFSEAEKGNRRKKRGCHSQPKQSRINGFAALRVLDRLVCQWHEGVKRCRRHLTHNVCHSSLAAESCLLRSKAIRIKSNVLGQEFVDDPDKLSGTVSKSSVMATALGTLQVVVLPEGFIVLHDIVC